MVNDTGRFLTSTGRQVNEDCQAGYIEHEMMVFKINNDTTVFIACHNEGSGEFRIGVLSVIRSRTFSAQSLEQARSMVKNLFTQKITNNIMEDTNRVYPIIVQ